MNPGTDLRSKGTRLDPRTWDEQSVGPSQIQALRALERWHLSDPARRPLTLFVIAEQLRSPPFSEALLNLIDIVGERWDGHRRVSRLVSSVLVGVGC